MIAIHKSPNISNIKGNQAMKFGQLIEYNMRNTFFEEQHIKGGGEISSRPPSKKSKLSIFLDQKSKVLLSSFLLYVQVAGLSKYTEAEVKTTCFILYKPFLKTQNRTESSLPVSFYA